MMVRRQLELNAILGSGLQYSTPQGYTALGQSSLLPVFGENIQKVLSMEVGRPVAKMP